MTGICDTCERLGELFRQIGRTDSNCSACSADIAMITSLYDHMKKASRERTLELEGEIAAVLMRLLGRCKAFCDGPAVCVSKMAA